MNLRLLILFFALGPGWYDYPELVECTMTHKEIIVSEHLITINSIVVMQPKVKWKFSGISAWKRVNS